MVTITQNKHFKHIVLVVDDNPQARDLLSLLLAEEGCKVITAADGFEAWHIFLETQVDLIITDLNMPCMNGNELISRIKTSGNDNPPCICISALPDMADRRFTRVIAKPFRIENLLSVIREVLSEQKIVSVHKRRKK